MDLTNEPIQSDIAISFIKSFEGKTIKEIKTLGTIELAIYFTDDTHLDIEAFCNRIHENPELILNENE